LPPILSVWRFRHVIALSTAHRAYKRSRCQLSILIICQYIFTGCNTLLVFSVCFIEGRFIVVSGGVERMANEEHLKMLWQSDEIWDQWRKDNPEIIPDLSRIKFRSKEKSWRINDGAIFSVINFRKVNLMEADLMNAEFVEANLRGADLRKAMLSGAELIEANLKDADLRQTDLSQTNLRRANLRRANLTGANLSRADLSEADLRRANLSQTKLVGANLTGAILTKAQLINANLDGANLTGVDLRGTQRAGWTIKGVICNYVYWHKGGEATKYTLGEFEKLFADQTKICLSYKNGISPIEIVSLPALIQHLEEMQGCSLRFVSIHEDSGGAVVELAVEDTAEKSYEEIQAIKLAIEENAKRDIEILRQVITGKSVEINLLTGRVEGLKDAITHILESHKGETIIGDKYEISGQAGAVGPNAHAHHNTFNQQINHSEQSIDLVAVASELAQLRLAIAAKQDSSPQTAIALGRVAEAELAATEKNTPKVIEHLKAAGKWTMDFAREIGKDVVAEAIRQAMGMP
jgi:uncharacterized protein YjbI with pentapeptide repeats